MSEKKDTPEAEGQERDAAPLTEVQEELEPAGSPEPPETEQPPARQAPGLIGAAIAIVIALAAAGGSYYLWQQQQRLHRETLASAQRNIELLTALEQRFASQQQRLDTLAQHRHADTQRQLDQIETQVLDLQTRFGQEKLEWAHSEVKYLLRVAEHRINLEQDKPTALAALAQARERLLQLSQVSYRPVIRQIDADIASLAAVTLPDREQIAADLGALAAAVESWPFAITERPGAGEGAAAEETPPEQAPAEQTGWQRMLDKVWSDVRSLVSIRHDDAVPRPLLEPGQRYFLQQNLQLKLEAARMALLTGNDRTYRDSLAEASAWIQRYFMTTAPTVTEAQSKIEQLADVELAPPLPALGESLRLLEQVTAQITTRREAAPEAPATAKPAPAADPPAKADAPAKQSGAAPASSGAPAAGGTAPSAGKSPAPAPAQESTPPAAEPSGTAPAQPAGDGS